MRTTHHPTSSSIKDRTGEFKSIVDSIRLRNGGLPSAAAAPMSSARHQLLAQPGSSSGASTPGGTSTPANGKKKQGKGEFAQRAQAIASDIASTTEKLGKLAQRELGGLLVWLHTVRNRQR